MRYVISFFVIFLLVTTVASATVFHPHSADTSADGKIQLREILRLIQFFNLFGGYHCQTGTEDGFAPGDGDRTCDSHDGDYKPQNWYFGLSELLRVIQMYNAMAYYPCPESEDGYCLGVDPDPSVWMPNLIGLDPSLAEATLIASGLRVEQVTVVLETTETDDESLWGLIASTNPSAGEEVSLSFGEIVVELWVPIILAEGEGEGEGEGECLSSPQIEVELITSATLVADDDCVSCPPLPPAFRVGDEVKFQISLEGCSPFEAILLVPTARGAEEFFLSVTGEVSSKFFVLTKDMKGQRTPITLFVTDGNGVKVEKSILIRVFSAE